MITAESARHHDYSIWISYRKLVGAAPSHHLIQCWNIVNWTLWNKFQWNFNQNTTIFIAEIDLEYVVWNAAAILSRSQYVNNSQSFAFRHIVTGGQSIRCWRICFVVRPQGLTKRAPYPVNRTTDISRQVRRPKVLPHIIAKWVGKGVLLIITWVIKLFR